MKKRKFMARGVVLLLMSIIMFGSFLLYAGVTPKSEKEIPVPSGSSRNANKESASKSQMGWESNPNLRNATLKVYNVKAPAEEVFNYYKQTIGGKEGSVDIDPRGIERGSVSQVWYEIEYYTDEDFRDYEIELGVKHPGAWMKQKLVENRKPHKAGQWIKEAKFNWYSKENDDDLTTFYVIISDNSFESASPKYKTNTNIEIQVTTEKSAQATRQESDEQMDKAVEERVKSLKSKPPTMKELGVPIYPGATFDAESSAGMSAGNNYAMYLYLTTDEPSEVVSFYEKQLKIKAMEPVKGRYIIPLKGKMPIPDEGISIEPNTMFGDNAKTVISIQKMVKKD